jgi:SpoVK/Ycf46/Vps4 family AAA+-type ATPase
VLTENKHILFDIDITEDPNTNTYYGFELDGNGRFLLRDSVVTHNTTIARIIGEMYKNMEILSPDGMFIIAKREDFVAEYLGQTAIKTKKLLESCQGGILFIDEVYALGPGKKDTDSFSKEAIDTLNVFLSENCSTFCCIIAGYEEDIKRCFFSVNQGLVRRFQWSHRIGQYDENDLVKIFHKLLGETRWTTDVDDRILCSLIKENIHMFKYSGGDIENLITKCKMTHAKRIISEKSPVKFVITNRDVKEGIKLMEPNAFTQKDDMNHLSMYM